MINLVKNATKFTNVGYIKISACFDQESQLLVVHVKDTGSGIAVDELPKLFSKFGKLHRTAELNHDGIGLGLMIVKQIVSRAGGDMNVESEGVGHGSTFAFTMPMEQAEPDLPSTDKSTQSLAEKRNLELGPDNILTNAL